MHAPFLEVSPSEAVQRLEAMLPGLQAHAAARSARRIARMTQLWSRVHSNRPPPVRSSISELDALAADAVLERAAALGWRAASQPIGESFAERDPGELARQVLGDLAHVPGDILIVNHDNRAYRVPAARLHDFIGRDVALTGDVSFDGMDELFLATAALHVVVVHHEGWAIDLRAP